MSGRRRAGGLRRSRGVGGDERGAAIVIALLVLVGLTALALALLSISALEPQISRNHVEVLRARYTAEAGIERAFDTLAGAVGSWNLYLTGATCATGSVLAQSPLPGLTRAYGEYTVRVRNDCAPGDDQLTGVAIDEGIDATRDTNGRVIVTSTGVVGTTVQTVTVVMFHGGGTMSQPSQSVQRAQVRAYNWADH